MSEKKRSWVWLHFSEGGDGKVVCNLCSTKIGYKGGSTSGLVKHLNYVHKKFDGSKTAAMGDTRQSEVTEFMKKPKKEMSREEYDAITRAAALMCATDI